MITPLPTTPPSKADPVNFDPRADALFGALPTMISEMNSTAAAADAAKVQAQTAAAGTVAAQGYANTATTKASEAAASASAALTYRNQAQTYASQAQAIAGGSVTWGSITGKPTTVAGYGITDAGLVRRHSTAQATFGTNGANEFWTIEYGSQSDFTLPPTPTDGQRQMALFGNGRNDNAVWTGGNKLWINMTQVGPGGDKVVIDHPALLRVPLLFVFASAFSAWFLC